MAGVIPDTHIIGYFNYQIRQYKAESLPLLAILTGPGRHHILWGMDKSPQYISGFVSIVNEWLDKQRPKGVTQKLLAKTADITEANLSRILTGRAKNFRVTTQEQIYAAMREIDAWVKERVDRGVIG